MLHPIQTELLDLSKRENLAEMTLRKMADRIGRHDASPQKIKHHLLQLQKKGFLTIDRSEGTMTRSSSTPSWAKGLLDKGLRLFSIPIVGTASCGPATIFAEQNFQGFLKISSRLVGRSKPKGLYAIKADGSSMNRANIQGRNIEDGDFVIVNGEDHDVRNNDVVVTIIDNKATIKRFIDDRKNKQIVLKADSSIDYEPIYLHPEDDFCISGKAVAVIKNPKNSISIQD